MPSRDRGCGACRRVRWRSKVRRAPWVEGAGPGRLAGARPFATGRMTLSDSRLSAGVVVVRRRRRVALPAAACVQPLGVSQGHGGARGRARAAAVREVQEESLIEDLEFRWGDSSTRTGPYSRGKVAVYFASRAPVPRTSRLPSITKRDARSTTSTAGWVTTKRSRWSRRACGACGRVGRQRHEPATRILGTDLGKVAAGSALRELVAYPRMLPAVQAVWQKRRGRGERHQPGGGSEDVPR